MLSPNLFVLGGLALAGAGGDFYIVCDAGLARFDGMASGNASALCLSGQCIGGVRSRHRPLIVLSASVCDSGRVEDERGPCDGSIPLARRLRPHDNINLIDSLRVYSDEEEFSLLSKDGVWRIEFFGGQSL
jgi:hypothetical protein